MLGLSATRATKVHWFPAAAQPLTPVLMLSKDADDSLTELKSKKDPIIAALQQLCLFLILLMSYSPCPGKHFSKYWCLMLSILLKWCKVSVHIPTLGESQKAFPLPAVGWDFKVVSLSEQIWSCSTQASQRRSKCYHCIQRFLGQKYYIILIAHDFT